MKGKSHDKLDEMQNQQLLQLEEYGFWIMFWAIVAAVAVQLIAGGSFREVAGELAVLLIGGAYVSLAALTKGIWTRKSTPTRKGSALAALVPAAAVGALNMIRLLRSGGVNTRSVLIAAAFAALAYAGCFIALECFRAAYDRRRAKLDSVEEEEE